MISYIRGELAAVQEQKAIVEAGGIGYGIYMSQQTLSMLPAVGEEVKIHTYLNVREDAMQLYGFLTGEDLQVFRLLIGVSGIGPKAALGILTAFSADELRFAVLSEDAKTIAKAPGIGVKTAKKMILELKDKLDLEDAFEKKLLHEQEAEETLPNARGEAVEALTALGYSPADALRAVQKVEPGDDMDTEAILKAALKRMI